MRFQISLKDSALILSIHNNSPLNYRFNRLPLLLLERHLGGQVERRVILYIFLLHFARIGMTNKNLKRILVDNLLLCNFKLLRVLQDVLLILKHRPLLYLKSRDRTPSLFLFLQLRFLLFLQLPLQQLQSLLEFPLLFNFFRIGPER